MQIGLGLSMRGPKGLTVVQRAINILRKYGTDAHVYLPGVGVLNGLTAGNYIDSTGTKAGVVDNPVGLLLDAAGGLGVELIIANMLSSGGNVISDLGGGIYKLTMNGSDPFVEFQFTNQGALSSRAHKIEFDVWTDSGQPTELNLVTYDNTVGEVLFSPSTLGFTQGAIKQAIKRWSTVNANTGFSVRFDGKDPLVAGSYFYFKVPIVREVTGIAASQALTGAKPRLERGLRNLLTWSGDFTNAVWVAQLTASKSGTSLLMPAMGDRAFNNTPSIPAGPATLAFTLSGVGTIDLWAYNGTNGNIGATQFTLTAVPTLYVININPTVTGTNPYFGRNATTGTATATSVVVTSGAIFQGTLTAAQIQANGGIPLTGAVAASNPDAGRYSWAFDGGDSLALGSVPFQMGDDHWVVTVAKLDAIGTQQALFCLANSGNVLPVVSLHVQSNGYLTGYWRGDGGVDHSKDRPVSLVSGTPFTASIRRTGGAAPTGSCSVNGVRSLEGSLSAIGAATLNTATLAAWVRTSTQYLHVGSNYVTICGKGTISDADLLTIERAFGALNGVQI